MIGFIFALVFSFIAFCDIPVYATELPETEFLDPTEEPETADPMEDPEVIVISPDMSEMTNTLNSIDEKLDTVVMALNPTVDSTQVSEYYREYFKGILQNLPYTEYICYAERVYTSSTGYNNYITHYYLLYDLVLEDGAVVYGTYPCIDVYSQDSVYYLVETTKSFNGYPTQGYASFAPYSALIDRSFDYRGLTVALISVLVMFLICRKTVFS